MDNQKHLDKLKDVLQKYEIEHLKIFVPVVEAVNEYRKTLESGEATKINSNSFPPEILRMMDGPALSTGWIYERLETAGNKPTHTTDQKIRQALGYHWNLIADEPVKLSTPSPEIAEMQLKYEQALIREAATKAGLKLSDLSPKDRIIPTYYIANPRGTFVNIGNFQNTMEFLKPTSEEP